MFFGATTFGNRTFGNQGECEHRCYPNRYWSNRNRRRFTIYRGRHYFSNGYWYYHCSKRVRSFKRQCFSDWYTNKLYFNNSGVCSGRWSYSFPAGVIVNMVQNSVGVRGWATVEDVSQMTWTPVSDTASFSWLQ